MDGLSEAFSFADYKQALSVQSMMSPGDIGMVQMATLAALGVGIVVLLAIGVMRRSGTAITGLLLVASVAVAQAILYGKLDFLTDGAMVLANGLTASALLLFVNAVLHTGSGHRILAALSALVIAVVIGLSVLTASGMAFEGEAGIAMSAANLLSVGLLIFALRVDPRGNGVLAISIFLALLASLLMTPSAVPLLDGLAATVAPVIIITVGILIATISAPFVGEDLSLAFSSMKPANSRDDAFVPGGSLFSDDDEAPARPRPALAERAHHEEAPAPVFAAEPEPQPEPEPVYQSHPSEPVSSYWHRDSAGGPMLEVAEDEYVWDALAQPEVRAGQTVLQAYGAETSVELSPEGLRGRLSAETLALFDDQVLGGGDPVSGPFDVMLATADASFRFAGRRQVDHDGILMRLDAAMSDVQAMAAAPRPAATAFATSSEPQAHEPAPARAEPTAPKPAAGFSDPVVRLVDEANTGFEIDLRHCGSSADDIRDAIDQGAARLAQMLAEDSRRGPFAVVDTAGLTAAPGAIASAVGKAVKAHNLPKGALLVALDPGIDKKGSKIETQATDIQRAGGGVALLLRDASSKGFKVQPNMLWISALDVPTGKHGPKKGSLAKLSKKFGAPVLVADIQHRGEAAELHDAGATFGLGRAFKADAAAGQGVSSPSYTDTPTPMTAQRTDAPSQDQGGIKTSLRARGLR